MPLSDTAIRAATPRKKLVKLSDGGGLYLLIQPHGTKLWRMGYRINGKQKTLAFGIYPTVSLAEARDRRDAAKKHLEDGGDPSVQRKIEKQARGNSFRLVAEEWSRRFGAKGVPQRRSQKRSGC
jgi:Arm DNA-binding domain